MHHELKSVEKFRVNTSFYFAVISHRFKIDLVAQCFKNLVKGCILFLSSNCLQYMT